MGAHQSYLRVATLVMLPGREPLKIPLHVQWGEMPAVPVLSVVCGLGPAALTILHGV